MNARILILVVLLLATQPAWSQTRKLNHRSHSGSPETFLVAMGADRLGEMRDYRYPDYTEVEPYVLKVRKHYERLASKDPDLNVAPQQRQTLPGQEASGDTTSRQGKNATPPVRGRKTKELPAPQAAMDVPSPEFLVHTQVAAAGMPVAQSATASGSNWWALFLLVPGVVFVASMLGRKPGAEQA